MQFITWVDFFFTKELDKAVKYLNKSIEINKKFNTFT